MNIQHKEKKLNFILQVLNSIDVKVLDFKLNSEYIITEINVLNNKTKTMISLLLNKDNDLYDFDYFENHFNTENLLKSVDVCNILNK